MLPKPFDHGLWILTVLGNSTVVAQVVNDQSEDDIKRAMVEHGHARVSLMNRVMISVLHFPMQARGPNGQTGFTTANMVVGQKHERAVEAFSDFPLHCALSNVAFFSEMAERDVAEIAKTVNNVLEVTEKEVRAAKLDLTLVKG